MNLLLALIVSLSSSLVANAGIEQAPPNFQTSYGKAVFVDFINAKYDVVYDLKKQEAEISSDILFEQLEKGFPVIVSRNELSEVTIDGEKVETALIYSPDAWIYLTLINKKLIPGRHVLSSKNNLRENVSFEEDGVASAFWFDDIDAQSFLELYAPANLEYDQVKMDFSIRLREADGKKHELYANGEVKQLDNFQYFISFPAYFTSSSLFLHLMPKGSFEKLTATHKSIDGREIPITIYGDDLENLMSDTLVTLAELERDYGPWPHPAVLIYGAEMGGGMEYSGATMTNLWALQHELFHSYHARSQMPANGNSGWLDEAIASFRDYEYGMGEKPSVAVNMAARSPYASNTSIFAYSHGKDLMNYFNKTFYDAGLSFKAFLRAHYEKYPRTTVTTDMFLKHLNSYSGMDFSDAFNVGVYGYLAPVSDEQSSLKDSDAPAGSMSAYRARQALIAGEVNTAPVNPYHMPMTKEQKRALLR